MIFCRLSAERLTPFVSSCKANNVGTPLPFSISDSRSFYQSCMCLACSRNLSRLPQRATWNRTSCAFFQLLLRCSAMLRPALFSLTASLLAPVLAVQVPLKSSYPWQDKHSAILSDTDPTEWNLDKSPNPNNTDHLVFETVYSLLQHWPNTRMRNGR